jgi:prevent-host-death family protein
MEMKPPIKVVTATEAKNRFGEIIKSAYLHHEHLIVERDGIPVVAIVSIADYERLVNLMDLTAEDAALISQSVQEVRARRRLQEFLTQAHAQMPDIPEDEADQDIAEAVTAARHTA